MRNIWFPQHLFDIYLTLIDDGTRYYFVNSSQRDLEEIEKSDSPSHVKKPTNTKPKHYQFCVEINVHV